MIHYGTADTGQPGALRAATLLLLLSGWQALDDKGGLSLHVLVFEAVEGRERRLSRIAYLTAKCASDPT